MMTAGCQVWLHEVVVQLTSLKENCGQAEQHAQQSALSEFVRQVFESLQSRHGTAPQAIHGAALPTSHTTAPAHAGTGQSLSPIYEDPDPGWGTKAGMTPSPAKHAVQPGSQHTCLSPNLTRMHLDFGSKSRSGSPQGSPQGSPVRSAFSIPAVHAKQHMPPLQAEASPQQQARIHANEAPGRSPEQSAGGAKAGSLARLLQQRSEAHRQMRQHAVQSPESAARLPPPADSPSPRSATEAHRKRLSGLPQQSPLESPAKKRRAAAGRMLPLTPLVLMLCPQAGCLRTWSWASSSLANDAQ